MRNFFGILVLSFVTANMSYAGDFLLCQPTGIPNYAGYSIDLNRALRGEMSSSVKLPTALKNYKIDLSIYQGLLRISLMNEKTGLKSFTIGDFQNFQVVYHIKQVSKAEAAEIGLFNGDDMITVKCFKSTFSPDTYKAL